MYKTGTYELKKFFNTSGVKYRELGLKDVVKTESDDKLLEEHPELGGQGWNSASMNYVNKKRKLIKLDVKMEQSRKRLANYKGE